MSDPQHAITGSSREDRPQGLGEDQLQPILEALLSQMDTLPEPQRQRLLSAADASRRRHEQLRQTVARLQETLDHLRLSVKYLCFDVEATRRENVYLRHMLEESRGED